MKLLLPVGGKSSRFPGLRPKWLLTMPNGRLMIERALEGINTQFINEIIVIMLEEHQKFIKVETLLNALKGICSNVPINVFLLKEPTPSEPATISTFLKSIDQDIEFFIKDSDCYFDYKPQPGNSVAFVSLRELEFVDACAKSYVRINNFNEIELIAEKKVISENFCCGGYGFKSSVNFLKTYENIGGDSNKDLYISHIIQKNLLEGMTFNAYEAKSYEDYGTLTEFQKYAEKTKTIFCDFDGVLVENSSKFANPPWQYKPINTNISHLSNYLENSKNSKLIITTSRPNSEKEKIASFLLEFNIKCHSIITDLPHSKRILINDFSKSNNYPSCEAINLPRDSANLHDYF